MGAYYTHKIQFFPQMRAQNLSTHYKSVHIIHKILWHIPNALTCIYQSNNQEKTQRKFTKQVTTLWHAQRNK